jgi:hypothetical protein
LNFVGWVSPPRVGGLRFYLANAREKFRSEVLERCRIWSDHAHMSKRPLIAI